MAVFLLKVTAIVTLLPSSAFSFVAAPPTKILRPHELHSFVEYINSTWSCPPFNDAHTVSCGCDLPHTVRCRGDAANQSSTIVKLTKSLINKEVSLLDLAVHNISELPDKVFQGLQLLGLVISNGGLRALSPGTFEGIEGSLAALGLPYNAFTRVPVDSLQSLTRLQRLDFSSNQIEDLPSRSFPTLIQLDSLSLAGNKLRTIQPEAFVKLPQLRSLNLARNQLDASQISGRTLWGLHVLNELSLRENLLKGTLTENYISGAKSITILDLSHNAITSISMGALKTHSNLQILDLSHNNIDIIEDHALRHLPELKELILSHNRILGVSGWSLSHIPKLTSLQLADNVLLTVTADLVHQLPNLKTLDLAANDITVIQPQVFNTTPLLEHLNLAGENHY